MSEAIYRAGQILDGVVVMKLKTDDCSQPALPTNIDPKWIKFST